MAAKFKVERTKGYTVMSNYHLRDKRLSLSAKGLLSYILSLPEDWDYTEYGLAKTCGVGRSTISTALHELEKVGYVERTRIRRPNGTLAGTEYVVYEQPREETDYPSEEGHSSADKRENNRSRKTRKNSAVKPFSPNAGFSAQVEKIQKNRKNDFSRQPMTEKPMLDFQSQVLSDYNIINTKRTNYPSIHPSFQDVSIVREDGRKDFFDTCSFTELRAVVKEQVDFTRLANRFGEREAMEIVRLIEDTLARQGDTKMGGVPVKKEVVRKIFRKVRYEHCVAAVEAFFRNPSVRNTPAYIRTVLYNSSARDSGLPVAGLSCAYA